MNGHQKKKKTPKPSISYFLLHSFSFKPCHSSCYWYDEYLYKELSATDREHSAWTFQRTWRKEKSFEFIHFKVVLIQIVLENKGNKSLSEEVEMTHWEQSLTWEASYVSAHEPGHKNHQKEHYRAGHHMHLRFKIWGNIKLTYIGHTCNRTLWSIISQIKNSVKASIHK